MATAVMKGTLYKPCTGSEPRRLAKRHIEDNGGKVSSSISSKTNFVVAGDKMGPSKRQKAESLDITIITEQEFLEMLQ